MLLITKYLIMIIPQLQGSLDQANFFVYAAADSVYFDAYGRALINSVCRNTSFGVHLHLYNPSKAQIEFCQQQPRVSVTWENFQPGQFDSAIEFWNQENLPEPYLSRRNKMLGIKVVDKSLPQQENVRNWLYKTYYACARFVRLSQMLTAPTSLLCIDVDGLVRAPFVYEFNDGKDFYLHEKDKGGHLAGAVLTNTSSNSLRFIQQLGQEIEAEIVKDNIFWFLDQWILDRVVTQYNKGYLPMSYIDWHMQPNSAIWSAKGKRKELEVFKRELIRYQ